MWDLGQRLIFRAGLLGRLIGLVFVLAVAAPPHTSHAQTGDAASGLVDAIDPKRIQNAAERIGSGTLGKDSQGDPKVSGRTLGLKYWIYFYGCDEGKRCEAIQFVTTFEQKGVDIAKMAGWNKDHHYSEAYLDTDGDAALEMTVVLKDGVSEDNLARQFQRWKVLVGQFAKYIGFR